ncbi:MAG: PD-(D/E)XK nuclease family protein, partial [Bacilli bacterium]|nr:PD-(D/E)XK nuclease family protein [Bacilli bacterium]
GVESLFLAHSDARALRLLLSKGYSLEKSKDILSSLRYWKGEIGGDAQREELSSIYVELREANYLYYDVYPERSFKGKDIYILGYPHLPRVESLLKGIEGTRLIQMEKKCSALPPLYVFKDPYEELHYIFNRIASLIDEGVEPDDIYLANVDGGYDYILPKMAKAYGFAIAPFSKRRLIDLPIGAAFLRLFEEHSLEETLSQLNDAYPLDPNLPLLSKEVGELEIPGFSKEKQASLYVDLLKSLKERHKPIKKAVHVLEGESAPKKSHVFYLNFSLGKAPHIAKDDRYLNDRESAILGAPTSRERNLEAEESLLSLLTSGNVTMLSICTHSFEGDTFFSPLVGIPLADGRKIEPKKAKALEVEYSRAFASFELANLLDVKEDYLLDDPKIDYLKKMGIGQEHPWRTYDPSFARFDAKLERSILFHSYSAIDRYYQCPFSYYLGRVLKIDESESRFSAKLGSIAHKVFELGYKDNLAFEQAYPLALEQAGVGVLEDKDDLFLSRNKKVLEAAYKFQRELTDQSLNASQLTEMKIDVKLSDFAYLTGYIDRVSVFGQNKDKIVITDYKSGDSHFDESLFEDGLGLQLPIYSYAAHKMESLRDKEIFGLFISRILPSTALHDQKNEEAYLSDCFKLKGLFARDIKALNEFSGAFSNHIAGTALLKGKDAFRFETYVREIEVFEEISQIAERKLLEADRRIRDGEFDIAPIKARGKKGGSPIDACEYCPFRDCCYRDEKVYRHVERGEEGLDEDEMEERGDE